MLKVFLLVAAVFCLPQLASAKPVKTPDTLEEMHRVFRNVVLTNSSEKVWVATSRINGVATAYCSPTKADYKTARALRLAQKLNGKGEFTKSGDKPTIGTISVHLGKIPKGTILRITDKKTGFQFFGTAKDTGEKMKKNHRQIDVYMGKKKGVRYICKAWGKREVLIETVKLDLSKTLSKQSLARSL